MLATAKRHNSPAGAPKKTAMRRAVLRELRAPASVLDVYCGPRGKMWREVWREAGAYVGIDKAWLPGDQRRRYVGDSLSFLRVLDVTAFNVVDVDAFGSPWEAVDIFTRRRGRLGRGERVGLVLTDGMSMNIGFAGRLPQGLAALLAVKRDGYPKSRDLLPTLRARAWERIALRLGARIVNHWHASSNGSGAGGMLMHYDALVLEGQG